MEARRPRTETGVDESARYASIHDPMGPDNIHFKLEYGPNGIAMHITNDNPSAKGFHFSGQDALDAWACQKSWMTDCPDLLAFVDQHYGQAEKYL